MPAGAIDLAGGIQLLPVLASSLPVVKRRRSNGGHRDTNLAHKKPHPPLGPPHEPRHGPTAGSHGVAVSYKQGTPVKEALGEV